MEVSEILASTKENMQKSLDFCQSQITKVRTGVASASLIDGIEAEAYGSMQPVAQVAGISTPDARTIMIQPWDPSIISGIERAILASDLGLNPQSDGNVIRIPIPPLTEERRLEYVKLCKKYAEEGKIAVRNIRRDSMDSLKKAEKEFSLSEDLRKDAESEVQKLTDDFIERIDAVFSTKEKELLEH